MLKYTEFHNEEKFVQNLCSTGAFRDSGAGAGAGVRLDNFEKCGCGCDGTRRLKNIKKYFYLYF